MDLKTTYTLMPLMRLEHEPVSRRVLNLSETFSYPFNSFPPLESHISPPLAVINGGPKLLGLDLGAISSRYHRKERIETRLATKKRLTLLRSIWDLFMGVKDLAKQWENENKEQKRMWDQDGDIVRLSQRTDRTTRSISKPQRNSEPTRQAIGGPQPGPQPGVYLGTRKRKRDGETMESSTDRGKKRMRDQDGDIRNSEPTRQAIGGTQPGVKFGIRKRKRDCETMRSSTTLNRDVLAQLGMRQKTVDSIKGWIESTAWHLPK